MNKNKTTQLKTAYNQPGRPGMYTDRQAGRHADRQTGGQTDRHACRQTEKKTVLRPDKKVSILCVSDHTHTDTHTIFCAG